MPCTFGSRLREELRRFAGVGTDAVTTKALALVGGRARTAEPGHAEAALRFFMTSDPEISQAAVLAELLRNGEARS